MDGHGCHQWILNDHGAFNVQNDASQTCNLLSGFNSIGAKRSGALPA
jgi:hypothetical protein